MAKIFISYSHEDIAIVTKVQIDLEKMGHEVWSDEKIVAGTIFPQAIELAIKNCDYMLIFLSQNSMRSEWVKREYNAYFLKDIENNRQTLITVHIDNTDIYKYSIFLKQLQIVKLVDENYTDGINTLNKVLSQPIPDEEIYALEDYNRMMFAIDMAVTAGHTSMMYYNSSLIKNIIINNEVKNAATLADEAAENKIKPLIGIKYSNDRIISEESNKKDTTFDLRDGYFWIIDPLDGTLNFLNRIDCFCSAIGIIKNGEPLIGVIYNPVSNEVYFGMNGIESQVWKISSGEVTNINPSQQIKSLKESVIATHISSREEIAKKMFDKQLINKFSFNFRHLRLLGCGQLALAFVASGKLQAFFQYDSYIWDQLAGVVILNNAKGIVRDVDEKDRVLKKWTNTTRNILACANMEIANKFETLIFTNP